MLTTGWPPSELAQDDDCKLFGWFASRLDARRRVREAVAAIRQAAEESTCADEYSLAESAPSGENSP